MINEIGSMILRVLIGSYFLAVALQIIPGTDLSILFDSILPAPIDGALSAGLVFLLAFMVMIGLHMRVAALVLAMMTFFASYLTMIQLGVDQELASFWRDIALIAALILTYSENDRRNLHRTRVVRRKIEPRRLTLSDGPRDPRPDPIYRRPMRTLKPRIALVENENIPAEVDNIFLDVHRDA